MLVVVLPVSVHHRGGLRGWRVVRNRPGGASPSGGGGGGRSGSQVEAREVFAKVLRRQVKLVQHLYSLLAGCWEKRVRSYLKEINCTPLRLEQYSPSPRWLCRCLKSRTSAGVGSVPNRNDCSARFSAEYAESGWSRRCSRPSACLMTRVRKSPGSLCPVAA